MDEVDVMTRAGETVGKAVGTGLKAARQGVVRAGHVAEVKLAERGITADQVRGALVDRADLLMGKAEGWEKQTRKSRKRLAKKTATDPRRAHRQGRRGAQGSPQGRQARAQGRQVRAKEIRKAAANLGAGAPKRRRWPWVLGLLVAAAAAGYVALTRRPEEVHLQDEEQAPPAEAVLNGQLPIQKEPIR